MKILPQDLRLAIRQFSKNTGLSILTILTLALGIGATTAIFGLINAVLLRPLPFPDQDQLVWLQESSGAAGAMAKSQPLSYPDFFDWRSQNRSFAGMASYRDVNYTLTGGEVALHLNGEVVSADFFRVLGISPKLGRNFLPDEEKPGARVVMLSHQLWQSAFNSASDIVGRAIKLNDSSYLVVGVMPADFSFPFRNPAPALWTTLADDATVNTQFTGNRRLRSLDVIARLKTGVSLTQAREDLETIAGSLAAQYPDTNKGFTAAAATPLLDNLIGNYRSALRLLFAAVTMVLLIACANVAGLLLAHASRRRPEVALRIALGASRGRIIRQFLVESIFLSLSGGALGLMLSNWILQALMRLVPEDLPRLDQVAVDGTVLLFTTLISVITGLLFGSLPAWHMSRLAPLTALREGGRSDVGAQSQHRVYNWLVIAETAIGVVLLVGSGLLIRSFVRVLQVDPGFNPQRVLTADLNLPRTQYSPDRKVQFYQQLLPRLAALPEVKSVGAGWPLPLSGDHIRVSFEIEGHPTPPDEKPRESVNVVTPNYFQTLGIPLLAGREFTWRDDDKGAPVVIINESFRHKYFPGENPIGRLIKSDLRDATNRTLVREIVGVVGNVKRQGPTVDADPQYYLSWAQTVIVSPTLCLRTAGNPTAVVAPLRTQIAEMDRDIPLYNVRTLEESISQVVAQPRFQALLLTCFAGMALLLSSMGFYAVLSYMVVQRTPEIGVRLALGAQRRDVLKLILRHGLTFVLIGIVIGLGASALLARLLAGMLYGTRPFDLLTFATVTAVILLVSLIASSVPAYRASRLDPLKALQEQ